MSGLFGSRRREERLRQEQNQQLNELMFQINANNAATAARNAQSQAQASQAAQQAMYERASNRRRLTRYAPGVVTSGLGILTPPSTAGTSILGN